MMETSLTSSSLLDGSLGTTALSSTTSKIAFPPDSKSSPFEKKQTLRFEYSDISDPTKMPVSHKLESMTYSQIMEKYPDPVRISLTRESIRNAILQPSKKTSKHNVLVAFGMWMGKLKDFEKRNMDFNREHYTLVKKDIKNGFFFKWIAQIKTVEGDKVVIQRIGRTVEIKCEEQLPLAFKAIYPILVTTIEHFEDSMKSTKNFLLAKMKTHTCLLEGEGPGPLPVLNSKSMVSDGMTLIYTHIIIYETEVLLNLFLEEAHKSTTSMMDPSPIMTMDGPSKTTESHEDSKSSEEEIEEIPPTLTASELMAQYLKSERFQERLKPKRNKP